MSRKDLTCAVCLYPLLDPTDFQGSVELFSYILPASIEQFKWSPAPAYSITPDYLGVTTELVYGNSGPGLAPTRTYDSVKSDEVYDIIFVPGGLGSSPKLAQPALLKFLTEFAPKATWVMSACTGSELLASIGWLDGKRATTSKYEYKEITARFKAVNWVAHARWVVDGNTWTSSGVTSGADMGYAFLKHLIGDELANKIRGIVEMTEHKQDDDEFAAMYGLE